MYERFTDRARKIMKLANQEAQRFNHEYIGTEHILLGLVGEGSGVGANVLKNLDVDLRKIHFEVEKLVQRGPNKVSMGRLPQTPRAKKVIEHAMKAARDLGHNYVGTEHVLLGLFCERETVAAQILMNLGLRLENVRAEVLALLGRRQREKELMRAISCPRFDGARKIRSAICINLTMKLRIVPVSSPKRLLPFSGPRKTPLQTRTSFKQRSCGTRSIKNEGNWLRSASRHGYEGTSSRRLV